MAARPYSDRVIGIQDVGKLATVVQDIFQGVCEGSWDMELITRIRNSVYLFARYVWSRMPNRIVCLWTLLVPNWNFASQLLKDSTRWLLAKILLFLNCIAQTVLSAGALAGIIIAAILLLALIVGAIVFFVRRRRARRGNWDDVYSCLYIVNKLLPRKSRALNRSEGNHQAKRWAVWAGQIF